MIIGQGDKRVNKIKDLADTFAHCYSIEGDITTPSRDELHLAIDELFKLNPKWESIDTAPDDGRDLLLYNGQIGIGYHYKWARNENGQIIGMEDSNLLDIWEWQGEGFKIDPPPTHWMPLPNKPE